jgi:hypothetical protein
MTKTMPRAARAPATRDPLALVIPPRYAMARKLSPTNVPNDSGDSCPRL